MACVVVTPTAEADLDCLIRTHSLPTTTRDRVRRSIEPLADFPELGGRLEGRWSAFRFILGPWRWMIIVYRFDHDTERVSVVTIQDGRSSKAATASSG